MSSELWFRCLPPHHLIHSRYTGSAFVSSCVHFPILTSFLQGTHFMIAITIIFIYYREVKRINIHRSLHGRWKTGERCAVELGCA
jgi:hypothetical protein